MHRFFLHGPRSDWAPFAQNRQPIGRLDSQPVTQNYREAESGGFGGGLGPFLFGTTLAGVTRQSKRNPRWALSLPLLALFALGGVARNSLPKGPTEQHRPGTKMRVEARKSRYRLLPGLSAQQCS